MSPIESYQSRDNKDYPMWINIDEVIEAAMPAYWSNTRERRRDRGSIFRGQSSDQWNMIPTLYRPPVSPEIINRRKAYTDAFINDLVKNAGRIGLKDLYDDKLLAIAQHYGFYTSLLDFTWNFEVAAYFATKNPRDARIGVVYGYSLKEYEEMSNVFKVFGMKREETDKILRDSGMVPLPILKTVEFSDVPRIHEQEGLFVEMNVEEVETFMHNCIDRFYFYQQKGNVYTGLHETWRHQFPSKDRFDSETTYQSYIEQAREQMPDLLKETPQFGEEDLFPPVDPISKFAEEWKQDNPDPAHSGRGRIKVSWANRLIRKLRSSTEEPVESDVNFQDIMNAHYFDRNWKSPYKHGMIRRGRLLIERISQQPDLNKLENLKWLVWELLDNYLKEKGYTCTLRLGMGEHQRGGYGPFYFILMERWLESNYRFQVPYNEIQKGWWCGCFDELGWHQLLIEELQPRSQPLSVTEVNKVTKGNPYFPSGDIKSVLGQFLAEMRNFSDGERGSCVFDLHVILMKEIGRELVIALGMDNQKTCEMASRLIRPEHDFSCPQFVVEIYDGFLRKLNRTSLCSQHWDYRGEGDVNMLESDTGFWVGLA